MTYIINLISESFIGINYEILPRCIEERMTRMNWDDVEFFVEIMDFLTYYDEFEETLKHVDRNAQINSYFDILLYMKTHSEIKINNDLIERRLILKDNVRIMRSFMYFIEEEERERNKICKESSYEAFTDLFNSIKILKESVLFDEIPSYEDNLKLNEFNSLLESTKLLDKKIVFVDLTYSTKVLTLRDLYENLSFAEKIGIAIFFDRIIFKEVSDKKIHITLNMALFIRGHDINEKFSKEINLKHPFLHLTSMLDDEIKLITFTIENCFTAAEVKKKIFAAVSLMCGEEKYSSKDNLIREKFSYFRKKCLEMMRIVEQRLSKILTTDLLGE